MVKDERQWNKVAGARGNLAGRLSGNDDRIGEGGSHLRLINSVVYAPASLPANTWGHVAVTYDGAEPLHERSHAIREKTLDPGHPHVAASLNNLAELYRAQGQDEDAERLLREHEQ